MTTAPTAWPDTIEIVPVDGPVSGTPVIPGSKSITNRALVTAALAEGTSTLTGALFSDDTRYMAAALDQLGIPVASDEAANTMTVEGRDGIPADSRAARADSSLPKDQLAANVLGHVRRLNEIAQDRGQKLAQMALQWVLRDPRVTSAVIGVSSVEQLDENLKAAENTDFTDGELAEIDRWAGDADGVNLWASSSEE